jgi:hypothetical protein
VRRSHLPVTRRGVVGVSGLDPDGLIWQKSSFSGVNGCLEVARAPRGEVVIRDSKHREAGSLTCGRQAWRAFLQATKAGAFDGLLDDHHR